MSDPAREQVAVPPTNMAFMRPMGATDTNGPALFGGAFSIIDAAIDREQQREANTRAILAEWDAAEARVLEESEPAMEPMIEVREPVLGESPRIEIFDDRFTIGLLAEFEADLKLDGLNPIGIGIRRNAAGGIAGLVICLAPHGEGGR